MLSDPVYFLGSGFRAMSPTVLLSFLNSLHKPRGPMRLDTHDTARVLCIYFAFCCVLLWLDCTCVLHDHFLLLRESYASENVLENMGKYMARINKELKIQSQKHRTTKAYAYFWERRQPSRNARRCYPAMFWRPTGDGEFAGAAAGVVDTWRTHYNEAWTKWPPFCTGHFNPPPFGQNGHHFADDIFKLIFLNENLRILMKISLTFVPKGALDDDPGLV